MLEQLKELFADNQHNNALGTFNTVAQLAAQIETAVGGEVHKLNAVLDIVKQLIDAHKK